MNKLVYFNAYALKVHAKGSAPQRQRIIYAAKQVSTT
jgi:hypothetical protein